MVAEISSKNNFQGNLIGVSVTTTWAIITMVVFGIGILMILLFIILRRIKYPEYQPDRNRQNMDGSYSYFEEQRTGSEREKRRKIV